MTSYNDIDYTNIIEKNNNKLNHSSQSTNNNEITSVNKNEEFKKLIPNLYDIEKLFKNVGIT